MTSNTKIVEFARQLADVYERAADLKLESDAIIEAAKEAGINTKALRKVGKEMVMQRDKLLAKYEDEEQLDMFRNQIGLRERKGLARLEGRELAEAAE